MFETLVQKADAFKHDTVHPFSQVLRYNAYFKESVTESNEENYRVRK